MDELANREKAFEKKFELDEEQKFKTSSRAARLFGLWVAEQMGLKGSEAEAYARNVVVPITVQSGHEHMVTKVEQDLRDKGVSLERRNLEKEFDQHRTRAQSQIAEHMNN